MKVFDGFHVVIEFIYEGHPCRDFQASDFVIGDIIQDFHKRLQCRMSMRSASGECQHTATKYFHNKWNVKHCYRKYLCYFQLRAKACQATKTPHEMQITGSY